MEFLGEVARWFTDPVNWSGGDGVPVRLGEHLVLSALPLALAMIIALPVGAWVGHTGRGAGLAVNLSNVGRAIPSLALLAIAAMVLNRPLVDIGLRREAAEAATIVAMLALAIPPILTNAYVGISQVDDELVEAGRGMGMREVEILRRVELPVALPVVLAGIRTAAVQVVATATLGAVFATGGFGRYIIDGIAQRTYEEVFAGALLVALLSIGTELLFAWIQRRSVSPGIAQRAVPGTFADERA
ncbi:MAG TPA: ABC transporter permease [Candidatus Limnocylindria bacterium]|nr:ABC transporter permease [Candidatus Limnocylindria bacterium]